MAFLAPDSLRRIGVIALPNSDNSPSKVESASSSLSLLMYPSPSFATDFHPRESSWISSPDSLRTLPMLTCLSVRPKFHHSPYGKRSPVLVRRCLQFSDCSAGSVNRCKDIVSCQLAERIVVSLMPLFLRLHKLAGKVLDSCRKSIHNGLRLALSLDESVIQGTISLPPGALASCRLGLADQGIGTISTKRVKHGVVRRTHCPLEI